MADLRTGHCGGGGSGEGVKCRAHSDSTEGGSHVSQITL
jgi:hypothetical protein